MTTPAGRPNKFAASFGKRLQQKRKSIKMTAEELSIGIGVKRPTVSMWETGRCEIPLFRLPDICRVLGMSMAELLGEEIISGYVQKSGFNEGIRRCIAETDYLFRMTGSPHYEALTKRFCSFLEEEGEVS